MCCQQVFLSLSFLRVLNFSKKWLPNHQYLCCNLEHIGNESTSVVHSSSLFEKIGYAFIVIETKTELCFSFSKIRSIIINLASQKVKCIFWVTVKGPTLNFKYLPRWFCCNSVRSMWSQTWQVLFPYGSQLPILPIFRHRYSH